MFPLAELVFTSTKAFVAEVEWGLSSKKRLALLEPPSLKATHACQAYEAEFE